MIPTEPLPPRYVCIWYNALGDNDEHWETFVNMLVYALRERYVFNQVAFSFTHASL